MKKMTVINRILLLLTVVVAAYEVVVRGNNEPILTTWAYTISFGVWVVAGLLLIILGFESLEYSLVVIVSTIIPLSLSLGLVSQYLPEITVGYSFFVIFGFLMVTGSRYFVKKVIATLILAVVHGVSGVIIFLLPVLLSIQGITPAGFVWVGVGGALLGLGGLMLSFLKTGKPVLNQNTILTILPSLLLLTMAAFALGFASA